MTDPYDADSNRAKRYGETRPTTLWLAVIPVVVISLIALAGGHIAALSRAGAAQGPGTQGPDDAVPSEPTPSAQLAQQEALIRRMDRTSTTALASKTAPAPPAAPRTPPTTAAPAVALASGCAAAEAWISAHAAPGFRVDCPAGALGHEAMTCVDLAGLCPGQRIIEIADPCPAAYMNEAHNSWILTGLATGRLDPYGACS